MVGKVVGEDRFTIKGHRSTQRAAQIHGRADQVAIRSAVGRELILVPSPTGVVANRIDDARDPALLNRVSAGVGPTSWWDTGGEIFGEDLGGSRASKQCNGSEGENCYHASDKGRAAMPKRRRGSGLWGISALKLEYGIILTRECEIPENGRCASALNTAIEANHTLFRPYLEKCKLANLR